MHAQTSFVIVTIAVTAILGRAVFHLAPSRRLWMPFLLPITIAIMVWGLSWQASKATANEEKMRAQMLRYLVHSSIVEEIEWRLAAPSAD